MKKNELPNPDVVRKPIVEGCKGGIEIEVVEKGKKIKKITPPCNKIFNLEENVLERHKLENCVCMSYEDPKIIWRLGYCVLASNKVEHKEAAVKINPLKASKRARRASK